MQDKIINLRPHHGMCFLNFVGRGYSDSFSENMKNYKNILEQNPEVTIRITKGVDDVCKKCPNNQDGRCTSKYPDIFDKRVLERTGLKTEQKISWSEFSKKTSALNENCIDEVCRGCRWLAFCKKIINSKL